jgi:predicted DNA-binding transcriptional regulator AlpA
MLMQSATAHERSAAAFGQGLRRERAAIYVSVSATKFDEWVATGVMPKPRRIDRCVIWLRDELDAALFALPNGEHEPANDVWRVSAS